MKRLVKAALLLACAAAVLPAAAQARPSEEFLRRDRAEIQRLNREAAARFARRDAGYRREAEASQDNGDYAKARAKYERDMAQWRARVAACNGGDWSACDR